jgi:hypothetical protein
MTVVTKVRIRWAAQRDGINHGHTKGTKTLCGLDEIRDRDGWPAHRRCLGCVELAKDLGWRG